MPNYTENLQLAKPLQSEQYNIDVFNANADKIDQFAGQTPARALTADKLTTGAKINGVSFKGDTDIITGAGFYYDTVTYEAGDLAFIYNQDGALELYKSLSAGNIGHNPLTSTGYWEKQDLGGSGGRNVGEIITSSLPLTDAGLHLLDGTRLSGDGIYGEFVQYIADLYAENPSANYFTTESNWQASVTQYGVCGKFVYDSTNNTVRLPKVSGKLDGTTDINALGDLEPLFVRLPNITANVAGVLTSGNGAFSYTGNTGAGTPNSPWSHPMSNNYNFNASRSSSVYSGNGSDTAIHEQAIKMFVYIVIATSSKTDIQVDIDEIATDLNRKLDINGANLNSSFSANLILNMSDAANIYMASMCAPSNRYINISLGANESVYTAPANGWYYFNKKSTGSNQHVQLHNTTASIANNTYSSANGNNIGTIIPVRKGDTVRVTYSAGGSLNDFRFIYSKGSESEAS